MLRVLKGERGEGGFPLLLKNVQRNVVNRKFMAFNALGVIVFIH